MFERYRPPPVTVRWPVRLKLRNGREETGSIATSPGMTVADAFNAALPFVNWRGPDELDVLLAKAAIDSVEAIAAPVADQLQQRHAALDARTAHAILGLASGAGPAEIRAAYRTLALKYHPDRFASAGLPREMADYAAAMFARVNAAHRLLMNSTDSASTQP
jgi:hypothetical protein